MTTSEALPLVRQMADGLSAIHRIGAVHRDVKSANVMLVPADDGLRVVVTDFGLASSALEGDDGGLGTPEYMAPEQVRGRGLGPAVDVHALGVVIYEMVTARLPFTGGSALEILDARARGEPPSPRRWAPDLPASWDEAILRCLRRSPAERFARVEDVVDALEDRPPALRDTGSTSLRTGMSSRLPAETDSFVGRDGALAELDRWIDGDAGISTLVGPPGCGKTRLALHFAWRSHARLPGGALFCDVSLARGADGIAAIVASALSLPLEGGDVVARLGLALSARGRALLVLDNVEQVLGPAAELVAAWTDGAPQLRVVLTSRERLGVRREQVLVVEPLDDGEALALFHERARVARPGFELDAHAERLVRDVLRPLEGQPLALELAAGRLQSLPLQHVLERLEDQLRVLVSARPDGHHASLTSAIDASWQLLTPWEKSLFAQCSVFAGGAALEAVEGVVDLRTWSEAPAIVDIVGALAGKSLLRVRHVDGVLRVSLLVSLHAFAKERLVEKGACGLGPRARADALRRHGLWFAGQVTEDVLNAGPISGGTQALRPLADDVANLDAACRRAVARRDVAVAASCCVAACALYGEHGPGLAGRQLADVTLALDELPPRERARVLIASGEVRRGDSAELASAEFEEAMAIAQDLRDPRLEGRAVVGLGLIDFSRGRTQELEHHAGRALEIATLTGEPRMRLAAQRLLGDACQSRGSAEEGLVHYEHAMQACREVEDAVLEATILAKAADWRYHLGRADAAATLADHERALRLLGDAESNPAAWRTHIMIARVHEDQGRLADARVHLEMAFRSASRAGARVAIGRLHAYLGDIAFIERRLDEAEQRYEESATSMSGIHPHYEAEAYGSLAQVAVAQDRDTDALSAMERSLAITHCGGTCFLHADLLRLLGRVHLDAGRLDEAEEALARAEPLLRLQPYPRLLARFLCTRGECELARGEVERARASLAEARALVGGTGEHAEVREALEGLESALLRAGLPGADAS